MLFALENQVEKSATLFAVSFARHLTLPNIQEAMLTDNVASILIFPNDVVIMLQHSVFINFSRRGTNRLRYLKGLASEQNLFLNYIQSSSLISSLQ